MTVESRTNVFSTDSARAVFVRLSLGSFILRYFCASCASSRMAASRSKLVLRPRPCALFPARPWLITPFKSGQRECDNWENERKIDPFNFGLRRLHDIRFSFSSFRRRPRLCHRPLGGGGVEAETKSSHFERRWRNEAEGDDSYFVSTEKARQLFTRYGCLL